MITILIPAYNAEKTLEKTIKSIIAQTYENWKLVIINDGSKDNTERICRKYSIKDKRINYYSQENKGLIETRKLLLRRVQGKYWTFVDADDILHCQMLELFVKKAEETNADIVMTKTVQRMSKHLQIGIKMSKIKNLDSKYEIYSGEDILPNFFMYPKYHVGVHSKLFQTTLLDDINLENLPSIFLGEDQCFNAIFYKNAKKVVVISSLLYNYRGGGPSHSFYPQLANDIIQLYRWRKKFIYENKMDKGVLIGSIINSLNIFKSLCEGNIINGAEIYNIFYEIIMDMNDLCPDIAVSNFYNALENKEKVFVEKAKIPFQVKLKQFILNHL